MCAKIPTVSDHQKPPPVYVRLAFDLACHKANWTKHQHYRLSCTATQGGHKPPLCRLQCALNVHGVQTSKCTCEASGLSGHTWRVPTQLERGNSRKNGLTNVSLNFELPPWTITTLTHRQETTNWRENRHDQQTHHTQTTYDQKGDVQNYEGNYAATVFSSNLVLHLRQIWKTCGACLEHHPQSLAVGPWWASSSDHAVHELAFQRRFSSNVKTHSHQTTHMGNVCVFAIVSKWVSHRVASLLRSNKHASNQLTKLNMPHHITNWKHNTIINATLNYYKERNSLQQFYCAPEIQPWQRMLPTQPEQPFTT